MAAGGGDFVREIDGSKFEGGGQILRIAISLAAITKTPIKVKNIRKGRSKPGLMAQHLTGITLVSDLCGGRLIGAKMGSCEVQFFPGKIKCGKYVATCSTAGAVTLVLQAALPVAVFADGPCEIEVKGGTDVKMAPPIDFFITTFRHYLSRFLRINFDVEIQRRGFFPRGGGSVVVRTQPVEVGARLPNIKLPEPSQTVARCFGQMLAGRRTSREAAWQCATGAAAFLRERPEFYGVGNFHINMDFATDQLDLDVDHCGAFVGIETDQGLQYTGYAQRERNGGTAEECGKHAAETAYWEFCVNGAVDTHMQDQLVIFMCLGHGDSEVMCGDVTLHSRSAIYVCQEMTNVSFQILQEEKIVRDNPVKRCFITCTGIGLQNK